MSAKRLNIWIWCAISWLLAYSAAFIVARLHEYDHAARDLASFVPVAVAIPAALLNRRANPAQQLPAGTTRSLDPTHPRGTVGHPIHSHGS